MRTLCVLALIAGGGDTIDRRVAERWEAEGVRPAPVADDYEFLRRLSLDLRGAIPTPEEIRAFAADRAAAKRERVLDAWLRGEAFATYWSKRWSDELTIQVIKTREINDIFRDWVRDAVRSNMPFDRFARRVLTAKGPTDLDPAAGFLVTGLFYNTDGVKDVTERVGRVFLGTQIRCAECHDHPFDDWTQQDFYGMAGFFWQARSEVRGGAMAGPDMIGTAVGLVVDDPARGEAHLPYIGDKNVDKKAGAGGKLPWFGPRYKATGSEPAGSEARRVALARFITADRQFARAAVNRHWGMLLGRGLVHPLDGFTATRKPSHPELLEELADDFVKSGFDPRRLIKAIVLSRPYQLSSKGASAGRLFAQAAVAPMRPDQLYGSVVRATGLDTLPEKDNPKGKSVKLTEVSREAFFREFRPDAESTEPTIAQSLFFLNGELVTRGITAERGLRLGRLLERERDPGRRLEELFLCTLSRPPGAAEAKSLLARIHKAGDAPSAYEDVFWALINSTEFVTRH